MTTSSAEEALARMLERFKGAVDMDGVDEIMLSVSKDDLATLGSHFIKSVLGFLFIATKPKPVSIDSARIM